MIGVWLANKQPMRISFDSQEKLKIEENCAVLRNEHEKDNLHDPDPAEPVQWAACWLCCVTPCQRHT